MLKIQNFSYHNHTNFSDGKFSLEDMVRQAKSIGFAEMGITDHLIVHKNIEKSPTWDAMNSSNSADIYKKDFKSCLSDFQKHCEHIRRVSKEENIKLYVGFEVDFFTYDGWFEELKEFLSRLDYDYVISGNHFLYSGDGLTIYNIHKYVGELITKEEIKNLVKEHFNNIRKAIESGLFYFLAHMDYVRNMGAEYCPSGEFSEEKNAVLDALMKTGTGIELSTKGLRRIGDYYPDNIILKEVAKRNIPVVISDDAHKINELGYDFDKAERHLMDFGVTNRIKLGPNI